MQPSHTDLRARFVAAGRAVALATVVAAALAASRPAAAQEADPSAPAPAPAAAAPASSYGSTGAIPTVGSNYKLRPGDEITLSVYGETTLSPQQPLRVLPGGAVEIPLVGEVIVGGRTPSQAGAVVARKLQRYLRDPRVTIALFTVAPIETLVLGNVRAPGKYVLTPPAKLTDVIAAAGGLGPTDGDLPDARIQSSAGGVSTVSLQKLLHDGDVALNVPVQPGDEVYVPSPNLFDVHVLGAVDKPGDVVLHEGDDIAMAVARAGTSTNANPDLNHITVTRAAADGTTSTTNVNLYEIIKGGDPSKDMKLKKGDLVYVPQGRKNGSAGGVGDALLFLRHLVFF